MKYPYIAFVFLSTLLIARSTEGEGPNNESTRSVTLRSSIVPPTKKVRLPSTFNPRTEPYVPEKWDTYRDPKFGFSIRYPVIPDINPPHPYPNGWVVTEVSFHSVYDPNVMRLCTFTDGSVKKWNDSFNDPHAYDGGDDGMPFPYRLKDMKKDLAQPPGTPCRSIPNGTVVRFLGRTALRVANPWNDGEALHFLFLGGTHWLEVAIRDYDKPDIYHQSAEPLSPETKKKKEAALRSMLDTFQFFEPKYRKTKKGETP